MKPDERTAWPPGSECSLFSGTVPGEAASNSLKSLYSANFTAATTIETAPSTARSTGASWASHSSRSGQGTHYCWYRRLHLDSTEIER